MRHSSASSGLALEPGARASSNSITTSISGTRLAIALRVAVHVPRKPLDGHLSSRPRRAPTTTREAERPE